MKHPLIRCADTQPQPWRNGGGLTRKLLAWPPGAGWQVRISASPAPAAA